MTNATRPPLITHLLSPEAYPHPVESVRLRETHISWVLLTGPLAYKIKKPVDLGFVDFSTFDRRRHFCEEEVRLNRRFAPDLYLDVVPITQAAAGYRMGGLGSPVEHAVRMHQFDEQQLASHLLAEHRLQPADVDELSVRLATFHETAARVGREIWGTAAQIAKPVADNFTELRPLVADSSRRRQLDRLEDWSQKIWEDLVPTFDRRHRDGIVRECHGDLHLGNIVRWQGAMTPFDCIEFNPAFRWIDVMNEVAFLVMDLDDHGRSDLGWRFLNTYLEQTGDYSGLSVLPFYLVYRAIVRAKVDALRLQQSGLRSGEQRRLTTEWHEYLDLADRYTSRPQASLTITNGVSGSGKTTGTQTVLERCGALRIRSDVERKRLFQIEPTEDGSNPLDGGIYSLQATQQTYDRLADCARDAIVSGFPVIVDATFLKRHQRQRFQNLATTLGVPFHILPFHADRQLLQERIRRRLSEEHDASDATINVLDHQLRTLDPLTDEERSLAVSPDELTACLH